MAKLAFKAGTTSKIVRVFIQDSSQTDGRGLTGLVFNSASLTCYYIKEGDASPTQISLLTATVGTWTTAGFVQIDATNMPGWYELHLPNAAIASGKSTGVMLKGAANMVQTVLEIELEAVDNQAVSNYGLTNLDATVATRATATALATVQADTDDIQTRLPSTLVSGRIDASVGAMAANTLTATAIATDAITAAKIAADAIGASELAADAVTEIQAAVAAGSVASVVGSVGSVTGNIGGNVTGNVTGSVGSVVAAVTIAAASITAIWDKLTSALTTVGSIGKLLVDDIDATISSRLASSSYTAPPSAATISSTVWAESVRAITDKAGFALSTAGIQAIWDRVTSALTTVGSIGKLLVDDIDVVLSTRSSASALTTAQADLDDIQTRLPAALVSGRIVALAQAISTDAVDAAALKADAVTEIQSGLATSTALVTAQADLTTLVARLSSARATLLDNLSNLDAAISTRLAAAGYTAPSNATIATISADVTTILAAVDTEIATILAAVDTEVAAIKAKTDNLPANPAAVGSAMLLDLTQAVPTTNTTQTVGDSLNAARAQGFGKWARIGTALNLYAADGTTIIHTFTLDSASAPTSRT